jgi:probable HAF family extracellular repeat protein
MTDLGYLPGGNYSAATAINDLGQVTGYSYTPSGKYHAFLWSKSTGMKDLGVLPNGALSTGNDINNSGQIVGWGDDSNSGEDGFVWSAATGMQHITVPPGATGSAAIAINDAGQIAGQYFTPSIVESAFFWSSTGGTVDIGRLPNTDDSTAASANSKGQVVGWSGRSGTVKIYLWSKSTGMVDLGWNGYPGSINDAGQIVFSHYEQDVYLAYPYSLTVTPAQVDPGKSTTVRVAIPFALSADMSVPLTCDQSAISIPVSVTIPKGKTSATFTISTTGVPANTVVNIGSRYLGWTFNTALTIPGGLSSLALTAKQIVGGDEIRGTVTLQAAATGDTMVTLTSNNPSVKVPASVAIPAGATTATFPISCDATITTGAATSIKASCGGVSKSVALNAMPENVAGVSLTAASVTAGTKVTGTVTLSYTAPSDILVNLTGQTGGITYPASVTIPAGSSSATFPVRSPSVTVTTAITVTATSTVNGSSAGTGLTVTPGSAFDMTLSPWSVWSGQSSTLTVTLGTAAPAGGLTFALSTSNPAAATFTTPTLTIAEGQTTGTAVVTSSAVNTSTQVTVSAVIGTTPHNINLTVVPIRVTALDFAPLSVKGGSTAIGTITLAAPAPADLTVALASGDPSVTVPATVTVPAGSSTATFTAQTHAVSVSATVTLSATCNGVVKHGALRVIR